MKSQTFGEKIKELRLRLNLSLKNVSEEIGLNARQLGRIERSELKAPEHIIKVLSKIYDYSYKDLIIKYLSEDIYYRIRTSEFADEVLDTVKSRLRKEFRGAQREESRNSIINIIKSYFSDKPVEKVWVFGSFARGNSFSKDSDIDIMVVFKKPYSISYFDIIEMKTELSQRTGRSIDLIVEGQELKSFQKAINREKLLVYGD